MPKIFLFFTLVLLFVAYSYACSSTPSNPILDDSCQSRPAGRAIQTYLDYIKFMKNVDWKFLKSHNVTLTIGNETYEILPDFLKEMEKLH